MCQIKRAGTRIFSAYRLFGAYAYTLIILLLYVGVNIAKNNDLSEQINESLTNESSETFNFGVKDGVRGFYTNPSRADDCFIPFKSGSGWFYTGTVSIAGDISKTITISCSDYSDYKNLTAERIKVGITGSTNTGNSWSSNGVYIYMSNYNASNGTITIKVNNSNSDICTTNISYIVCII